MRVALADTHYSLVSEASSIAAEEIKVQQITRFNISLIAVAELTAQETVDQNRLPNHSGPVKKRGKGKTKRW